MAQNIVKSIRSDKPTKQPAKQPTKQPKSGLDKLPETKQTKRLSKTNEVKKNEGGRTRFGHLSAGYSPNRKARAERNGAKIK